MKKVLLLLMLPLLAITLNSCAGNDYEKMIVGTWEMVGANNEKWPYEATTATLTADKTYTTQGYFENGYGTYAISGNKITFYYKGETPYFDLEMISWSKDKGTFKTFYRGQTITVEAKKLK